MNPSYLLILAGCIAVANSQIGGLSFLQASIAAGGGLAAAVAGGAALGGIAAAATNAVFRRGGGGRNNRGSRSYYRGGYSSRRSYRGKREVEQISLEELAEMDEFDCGKQYLCELTAIQATNKNIQDPLVLALQQNKVTVSPLAAGFKDAVNFGLATKDEYQCSQRYKECKTGKQTMVEIIQFLVGIRNGQTFTNEA